MTKRNDNVDIENNNHTQPLCCWDVEILAPVIDKEEFRMFNEYAIIEREIRMSTVSGIQEAFKGTIQMAREIEGARPDTNKREIFREQLKKNFNRDTSAFIEDRDLFIKYFITPLKGIRYYKRLFFRMITLNGMLLKIQNKFVSNAFPSLIFFGSSTLLALKDLPSITYDSIGHYFGKIFFNLFLVVCGLAILEIWILIDYYYKREFRTRISNLRREQFERLQQRIFNINSYSRDFTWDYNSEEDDPILAHYTFVKYEDKNFCRCWRNKRKKKDS